MLTTRWYSKFAESGGVNGNTACKPHLQFYVFALPPRLRQAAMLPNHRECEANPDEYQRNVQYKE